jgi:hypothetical protein
MQDKWSGSVRRVSGTPSFRPQFQAALSSARQAAFSVCRCAGGWCARIHLINIVQRHNLKGTSSAGLRRFPKDAPAAQVPEVPYSDLSASSTGNTGGGDGRRGRAGEDQLRMAAVLPYFLFAAHTRDSLSAASPESHSSPRPAVILGSRGLTDNLLANLNTRKADYGG